MRYILLLALGLATTAHAGFWPNADEVALERAGEATTCWEMGDEIGGVWTSYIKKTDEAMALLEERGVIGHNIGSWIQAGRLTQGMTTCEVQWSLGSSPDSITTVDDRHASWYYRLPSRRFYLRFEDGVLYSITEEVR